MNKPRLMFLEQLKEEGLVRKIPNISKSTAEMLHFLILSRRAKSMLEIGTANGYSSIWFADALEQNNGELFTVEISEPSHLEAQDNFKKAETSNIVSHLGDACEYIKTLDSIFDVVFIDAQKSQYKMYWDLIQKNLHKDSLIIVDDVIKFAHKEQEFLQYIQLQSDFNWCIVPVDGDDGAMLLCRK